MTFQKTLPNLPDREEENSGNKGSQREGRASRRDFAKELNVFKRAFKMRIEIKGLAEESH